MEPLTMATNQLYGNSYITYYNFDYKGVKNMHVKI